MASNRRKAAIELGPRLRAWRQRQDMAQVRLAERLGISASYLNLIEHGRRPLTAPLLIRFAQEFDVDLGEFSTEDGAQNVHDLVELFGDGLFEGHDLSEDEIVDFAARVPGVSRAVLTLYEAYREAKDNSRTLASRMAATADEVGAAGGDVPWRLPSEEVNDLLQRRMNYFPELEEAAEALWEQAGLQSEDLYGGLVRYLQRELGIEVQRVAATPEDRAARRYIPERKLLLVSELLAPHSLNFQIAHQIGLLSHGVVIDRLVEEDRRLTTADSRTLARVALANYFAGAVMMPYMPFLQAARARRYDVDLLGHRFRASFEQVCHRLTCLRKPGHEGVPFHFLRVDIAGNISQRFSASGISFARFSGACPRWNLVVAFMTPGQIRAQLSEMPDGSTFFCIARTVNRGARGYHAPPALHAVCLGCRAEYASELVYSDGVDLDSTEAAVPVGVTCRLCERTDCDQRALPPLQQNLKIDENVRGFSFYASARDDS